MILALITGYSLGADMSRFSPLAPRRDERKRGAEGITYLTSRHTYSNQTKNAQKAMQLHFRSLESSKGTLWTGGPTDGLTPGL